MTAATCKKVREVYTVIRASCPHTWTTDFILRIEAGEKASERIKHLIFCFFISGNNRIALCAYNRIMDANTINVCVVFVNSLKKLFVPSLSFLHEIIITAQNKDPLPGDGFNIQEHKAARQCPPTCRLDAPADVIYTSVVFYVCMTVGV